MISSSLPVLNNYSFVKASELEDRVHRLGIDTIDIFRRAIKIDGNDFRGDYLQMSPVCFS